MKLTIPLLLILLLTACGGGRSVAPVSSFGYGQERSQASSPPSYYTVRKGDTLYSICWRYGLDYKQVARINGINKPYTIYAGQKIKFKGQPASTKQAATSPTKTKKQTTTQSSSSTYTGSQNLNWRWPTKGKLLSTYSTTDPSRKGINISGAAGQVIVAAASGKVVYSGNGLPRYGNLLIIKHNDVYLSAYANNQKLLVKEGDIVKSGQKIALLGSTGSAQRNQLHFEIRRNGKPIDPLRFLPKQ